MKFSNLRVGTRLSLAFGSILLLMILLSLLAIYNLMNLQDDMDKVVNDTNVRMEQTYTMLDAVNDVSRYMRNIVLITDGQGLSENLTKVQKARETYDQAHQVLMAMPAGEKGQLMRDKLNAAANVARSLNAKVIELGLKRETQEALDLLLKQAAPATEAWTERLSEYIDYQKQKNQESFKSGQSDAQQARAWLIAGNVLGFALILLLGWLVSRSITGQLGGEPTTASELAQSIAQGDLSVAVQLQPGDSDSMMAHFKLMVESLSRVVSQVRQNAEGVASVSGQIAQGNQDLSQRTEEQASALEQTAASMDELGGTARLNADNVQQASQLALNASSVATRGGQVVERVVDTMKGINEASQKIGNIINVIDGIAFQTNILALNAAVEAARAGEQGRGFAVVASEVRSLAQRSAEAAKEIKQLISTSVERVGQGTTLVDQAGSTMADVVAAIKKVTDLMHEINVASTEQSANVAQVSHAVGQMDQMTQQNAALVEQGAAAAHSLREQSQRMVQAVAAFRLSYDQKSPSRTELALLN